MIILTCFDRFLGWVGTRGHFDFYELCFAGLIGCVVTMVLSAVLDGILRQTSKILGVGWN